MKRVITIAILGAATLTSAAFAQSTANNVKGLYIQGETGYADQSGLPNFSGTTNPDKSHWAGRAAIGYAFDLGNNFSLGPEIGLGYYGNSKYNNIAGTGINMKMKSQDIEALAVGSYAFAQQFNVFAKAGLAYNDLKVSGNYPGADGDAHAVDPVAAVGLGYNFMKDLGVTVTYSHIFGKDSNSSGDKIYAPKVDTVMAGVKYSF